MRWIVAVCAALGVAVAGSAQAKCPNSRRVTAQVFALWESHDKADSWQLTYPYQPENRERVLFEGSHIKRLLIGFPFPLDVDGVECQVRDLRWAISTRAVGQVDPLAFYVLWNEGREPGGDFIGEHESSTTVGAWWYNPYLRPHRRYKQLIVDGWSTPIPLRRREIVDRAFWDASMFPDQDQHLWFGLSLSGFGEDAWAEFQTSGAEAPAVTFFFEDRTEPLE